jgi:glycosyltransferase involved in cell wall biosynthesis
MGAEDVSVIVPTHNRSSMLATALHCVLGQADVDIEVIVVDDASTDNTCEMVGALDDPRVRLIRHTAPQGPNAARNRGAGEAQGGWIAFLDDDDIWAPDKLARQLRTAEESTADWVYAGSVNVNEGLEVIHGIPPLDPGRVMDALLHYNPIPASASNVAVRRAAFEAENGFNEHLRACEEWDLWIRLSKRGAPAWVPSPLVAYRMHGGNAILDVAAVIEGAHMIEQLHGTEVDWGRFHRWIAQLCVRSGRRGEALRHFLRAALAGQRREVALDLAGLARGVLRRALGGSTGSLSGRADLAWQEQADPWIEDVRGRQADPLGGQG